MPPISDDELGDVGRWRMFRRQDLGEREGIQALLKCGGLPVKQPIKSSLVNMKDFEACNQRSFKDLNNTRSLCIRVISVAAWNAIRNPR